MAPYIQSKYTRVLHTQYKHKGIFILFFVSLDDYFCNPPCAHLASRNSNICKKFQLSPTILQNLILQKQKHKSVGSLAYNLNKKN